MEDNDLIHKTPYQLWELADAWEKSFRHAQVEAVEFAKRLEAVRGELNQLRTERDAPTKDRINVHEYTARMSLDALKFYTEWMQTNALDDIQPIEHSYAMQAIEEIESLLPEQDNEHY